MGLFLGFMDLLRAGMIDRLPRLVAVQSAACDPIYRAWAAGLPDVDAVEKRPTAAEGISVARPVRGKAILQAVRDSGGLVCTVTDDKVWDALPELGHLGIYVEPTSAAAPAAFAALKNDGTIPAHATAVVMLTGSGLKATDKIVEHFFSPAVAIA